MKVKGLVALVSGGASGLGAAAARRLCNSGAKVVIADLNGDAAAELAAELDGTSYALDVRDESAIAAMVAETEAEFGQIDLFCSNAGILNLDGDDDKRERISWSRHEDELIIRNVDAIGNKWHQIAAQLPPPLIREARQDGRQIGNVRLLKPEGELVPRQQ